MLKELEFYSDGYKLKGNLYLPKGYSGGTQLPAIILCHGFAGIKELLLPNFALKFAEEGYAVFTFDYRGFGESDGPQGQIIPEEQVRDIRSAITFISSQAEINSSRIGLWGTSLGGANALIASANDERVKALCIQIAFGDGERNNTYGLSEMEKTKRRESINKSLLSATSKNKIMKLPLKKILSDDQSQKFFEEYSPLFPEALKVKVPFTTISYIDEWKPEKISHKINIPVLIVGAARDKVNHSGESEKIYSSLTTSEKKIIMVDSTHYDIYTGDALQKVSAEQLKWYDLYL
ncbi:alpha/beta hydrolase [Propionigenium maris DSM 9537]|uniref:Alpha/beta hydrolase n=1 Tax=Propionigenium maris DSM 9537 TaxID=1123000 RepID=A0A9W6GIW1_9FUSO|nr:alpha/beta fold hydrolase [Propionigenium maris]GLI54988.1 alpha/beta hydrolase [Propionigenium maris DSM 9537]